MQPHQGSTAPIQEIGIRSMSTAAVIGGVATIWPEIGLDRITHANCATVGIASTGEPTLMSSAGGMSINGLIL
jgi:hypothetical protein